MVQNIDVFVPLRKIENPLNPNFSRRGDLFKFYSLGANTRLNPSLYVNLRLESINNVDSNSVLCKVGRLCVFFEVGNKFLYIILPIFIFLLAVPCPRRLVADLSPWRTWFDAGPERLGFVADRVLVRVVRFSRASIIPSILHLNA